MKSVIIATGNNDKFEQIRALLTSLKINTDKFLSLKDLGITNDQPEVGSRLERAKQKAYYTLSQVDPKDYSKYLCIVANDTATKLPTEGIETEESKKIAARILSGELLKPGDPIHYTHSYVFITFPDKKMYVAESEIPYTYLGNPKGIRVDEKKSTLVMGNVCAIPGQNIPNIELPEKERIAYRLKFLKKVLIPIVNKINIL